MEYKRCTRCIMDNKNDDTITFNEQGECNYCSEALRDLPSIYFPNKMGMEKIKQLVSRLKKEGEGKEYDCFMGISGGLDSAYLAYLGYQWGLRILALHFDDGFDTEIAKSNINKLCKACNIDLKIVKPNPEQYNDITRAYFLAEVPEVSIPQNNMIFAQLYYYAKKFKIHSFLSGGTFALECILKQDKSPISIYDMANIKDIHKKFGRKSTNKLLFLSNYQRVFDRYIWNIQSIRPLNYIDYNRNRAIKELYDFCDFNYYEMKHCENYLTKIVQLYWLSHKFDIDKRNGHFSSMIVSGQLTRDEALAQLKIPIDPVQMNKDIDFVLSKIDLPRTTFDQLVSQPGKFHTEYKTSTTYKFIRKNFKKWIVKFKG